MGLMERLVKEIWKAADKELPDRPFIRMAFDEAMHRFGVDKPDTRYGIELKDVDDLLQETEFVPFKTALAIKPPRFTASVAWFALSMPSLWPAAASRGRTSTSWRRWPSARRRQRARSW